MIEIKEKMVPRKMKSPATSGEAKEIRRSTKVIRTLMNIGEQEKVKLRHCGLLSRVFGGYSYQKGRADMMHEVLRFIANEMERWESEDND